MSENLRILVTGATGFLGHSLVKALRKVNYNVVVAVRTKISHLSSDIEQLVYGDFSSKETSFNPILPVDCVIHTAARVHIMHEQSDNPLTEFRQVNAQGTLNLAKQAAEVGVKRFIFISSVKVNGEATKPGKPFTEEDKYIPIDPYALSKYEAEQGLLALSKETGMEVVIIRPPLVYGPGVKANFASMMKWVSKGIPLPLGAVHNKRSLVALDNLVSFIIHCIDRHKAANEIFLISDGEDVSTTELIKKMAQAFGKKAWLLPIPVSLMSYAARLVGKSDMAERLFGSLQVDSAKARHLLDWKPVITMDEQLKKTAETYMNNEKTI